MPRTQVKSGAVMHTGNVSDPIVGREVDTRESPKDPRPATLV